MNNYTVYMIGRDKFGAVIYKGSEPFQITPNELAKGADPDKLAKKRAFGILANKSRQTSESTGRSNNFTIVKLTKEIPFDV